MDINGIQTLISVLIGGGILGFIEFLLKRKYEKEDKHDTVIEAIKELDEKVDEKFSALDRQSMERFNELNKKIDEVERKGDERAAVSARVRILRFADEMMDDRKHSKDSWDQAMSDCDNYEKYCETHPEFRNNMTSATVAFLKDGYQTRLQKHDFYVR